MGWEVWTELETRMQGLGVQAVIQADTIIHAVGVEAAPGLGHWQASGSLTGGAPHQ